MIGEPEHCECASCSVWNEVYDHHLSPSDARQAFLEAAYAMRITFRNHNEGVSCRCPTCVWFWHWIKERGWSPGVTRESKFDVGNSKSHYTRKRWEK